MATYDNLAKYYDGLFVRPWLAPYHKQALNFIAPSIKNNEAILDIGCGTGSFLKQIHKNNNSLKIFGIDESPKMIKRAQKKKIPNATFQTATAENIPFPEDSFDLITSVDSFYYFKQGEFFSNCYKALKPGGLIFIDTISVDHYRPIIKPLLWLFKLFAIGQNTKHLNLEEITQLAQRAGFTLEKKSILGFPGMPLCRRWLLLLQKTPQ